MSYVYCDESIGDVWSYARYFPLIDGCLLDFVSQNYFWDRLKKIKVVGEVVVTDDFRIDLVVWEFYKSKEYWWIVLLYNGVLIEDVRVGTRLLLPDASEIDYLLADVKLKARMG